MNNECLQALGLNFLESLSVDKGQSIHLITTNEQ